MSAFSGVGPTSVDGWIKPDLVTAGQSVVSLRAPGSTIDTAFPSAVVGAANFVGSGTSFSAAITSGAAALVVQLGLLQGRGGNARSGARPDAVKAKLLGSATAGPLGNPFVDGHGQLNAFWAAINRNVSLTQAIPTFPTLAGSDVSLSTTWSGSAWNGSAWNGSAWNGSAWNGAAWTGSAWNGSAWNGSAWNGSAWNGSAWNGRAWNGSAWNGSAWNGSAWNGSAWNGSAWNGSAWNGSAWNGSAWNGSAWN
jgi:serine protease AprX